MADEKKAQITPDELFTISGEMVIAIERFLGDAPVRAGGSSLHKAFVEEIAKQHEENQVKK